MGRTQSTTHWRSSFVDRCICTLLMPKFPRNDSLLCLLLPCLLVKYLVEDLAKQCTIFGYLAQLLQSGSIVRLRNP